MANAINAMDSLQIKREFQKHTTIPEAAKNTDILRNCLLTDPGLRDNLEFTRQCVQVDPDLIHCASRRVQKLLTTTRQVALTAAPHLKNISPSVEKKVKEAKMVQRFTS